VYLKRGAKGSILFHGCRRHFIPSQPAHAIDTTGAGDAYAAGALYGLSRGYSPLSSGKIGCFLATKVVGKLGAGIPLRHIRLPIGKKRGLR
jgi:sugar/nucleoside kinase (ribokinase family)